MNLRSSLIAVLAAAALSSCGQGHDSTQPPAAAESATDSAPAASDTQAFFGDEAPVIIKAAPGDDHGHSHDADGDQAHADDENHDHGDGSEHAH